MAGKLVVIFPDGSRDEEDYTGREPEMEQLIKLVGGWVEQIPAMVRYDGRLCKCYADEEGLLKGLPVNHTASRLVRHHFQIVGRMVIEVPGYGHERSTSGLVKAQLQSLPTPYDLRAVPRRKK